MKQLIDFECINMKTENEIINAIVQPIIGV